MGRLGTIAVSFSLLAVCLSLRAEPTSPEEAQKKLEEKQKQRSVDRSQILSISAGELQDMRAEIAMLRGEVARLKAQGGVKPGVGAKKHDTIEIGMTRQEVMAFVEQHSKEFKITGINAYKPAAARASQTVTRSGPEGSNLVGTGTVEQTENITAAPKQETIDIDHFQAVKVAVGERPSFGVTYTEYEWQYQKIGGIRVQLEDDKVSGVTAGSR